MKKIIPKDAVLIPDRAKLVFRGVIYDVYQWEQSMFDGGETTFEMLKRPDTVTVIAVTKDGILVLDDEQPHSGSRKSFPGGRVDVNDDDVISAAKREVKEETGYLFNNWRILKVWQPHTKIEWFIYIVLAWDESSKEEAALDSGERITVHQVPFDEIKKLVINKSGYLGESTEVFKDTGSIGELLALPEFEGNEVER